MVPKTVPYKQIKAQAAAKRAQLNGQRTANERAAAGEGAGGGAEPEEPHPTPATAPNGKKHKSTPSSSGGGGRSSLNGSISGSGAGGATISGLLTGAAAGRRQASSNGNDEDGPADPNDQLQFEASQARGEEGGDVEMTG